jgi:hypothetical protein
MKLVVKILFQHLVFPFQVCTVQYLENADRYIQEHTIVVHED